MRTFKGDFMKQFTSLVLLAAFALLSSGCISRTSSSEQVYGHDMDEKKIIWIWQKEYRDPK
jgi:hypothetical protein